VPSSEYLDPEIVKAERAFLRTVPLMAAHSSQLPEPHSYRCEDILDVPVLLIRDAEGQARAYLNSCSHRGARLLEGEGKTDGRIRCSYHAWSYSPKGELLSVTQDKKFGNVNCTGLSLVELPCAERYGLIFVMLDPEQVMDIDTFIGDFAPHLEMANLSSFAIHECRQLTHDASWKLALCGYLESYHVRVVHAGSIGGAFVGNLSTHDAYGPEQQHLLTTWPMMDIAEIAKQPDVDAAIRQHPYSPHNTVLYLWPCTIITAPDFIGISHLIRVMPGKNPGEQLTEFRILLPKEIKPEERQTIEDFDDLTVRALEEEDYAQLRGIQKALNSGLRKGTLIGANEPSLTAMHRSIARAAGRDLPDGPAE
jgi:phenylpropionate dioxygenase-like ring-hydroxylating dioxygenase large terminal subunit